MRIKGSKFCETASQFCICLPVCMLMPCKDDPHHFSVLIGPVSAKHGVWTTLSYTGPHVPLISLGLSFLVFKVISKVSSSTLI